MRAHVSFTVLDNSTSSVYFVCMFNVLQVFQPDGNNGYKAVCEEEAGVQRQRNKPKKLSPRMR